VNEPYADGPPPAGDYLPTAHSKTGCSRPQRLYGSNLTTANNAIGKVCNGKLWICEFRRPDQLNKNRACQFALIGLLGCPVPPTDAGCPPRPMPCGVAQTANPIVVFDELYADGPPPAGDCLNRHCA